MVSLYEKWTGKAPPFSQPKAKTLGEESPAELPKEYRSKRRQLPSDVQEEIDRYLHIFNHDITPVLNFIDEIFNEQKTDYFENDKQVEEIAHPEDVFKWKDYQAAGKTGYDVIYRKESEGAKRATKKLLESKVVQPLVGISSGLWNTAAGVAELGAALTDLTLDTETLAKVEKAIPAIDLLDIYGDRQGSIAKFTSILTQYGTGFGIAQKISRKLITSVAKKKLAKRAATKLAATKAGQKTLGLAKFGGYWVLPAALGDAAVSTQANITMGDAFGDPEARGGFMSPTQRLLANSQQESLEGLTGKERAATVLRNKLKFGAEGTVFMGGLSLVGDSIKYIAKGTGAGLSKLDTYGIQPASELLGYGANKLGLRNFYNKLGKKRKNLMTKWGIPKYEHWKFSETSNIPWLKPNWVPSGIKVRGLVEATASRFASGFKFDKASADAMRKVQNEVRRAKKFTDLEIRQLDREMYGLVKAGFKDRIFTTQTSIKAQGYWDEVLKYMKKQIPLDKLPKSLRMPAYAIRQRIDEQTKRLQPIIRDQDVREELEKNLSKYLHTSYEIFKNTSWRAPQKVYDDAITWYANLITKNFPDLNQEQVLRRAQQMINKVLEIGRHEGSTPGQRLHDIANAAQTIKIPAHIFKDVKNLPDEIAALLGRVDDPKNILMDTVVEQAHTIHAFNAYRDLKNTGLGRWIFRNQEDYNKFLDANKISNPRNLQDIKVSKPYNLDIEDIFTTTVKGPKGGTTKVPMQTLPEMAKAISDTSVMMDGLLKFPIIKSLLGIKAATQINKTVLSVMTQMRNITTASLFALANGHVGVGASVSDDFNLLFKELIGRTKDPKKLKEALDEALEAGALDSSTIATELEKLIPEMMGPARKVFNKNVTGYEGKTSDQFMRWMFTNEGLPGKIIQKSIEAYQVGDNIWKMYGYNFTKSQLKPAFKKLDDVRKYFREVEGYEWNPYKSGSTTAGKNKENLKTVEDAIKEVSGLIIRDTYPNYSMVPRFVQNVRKFPLLGNFVGFTSEMWRNSYHISRRGMKELGSTNPYIRQMGARRVMGFGMTLFALGPIATQVASDLTGVTLDQIRAWKESFAPEYQKGHRMIPISAQDPTTGNIKAIDFDSQNPYTDVQKPFKILAETIGKGPKTDESFLRPYVNGFFAAIKEAGEPFFAPAIWAQTVAELVPWKNWESKAKSGRVIANWENDPRAFEKVMYHIYSTVLPTSLKSGEKLWKAFYGQVSRHNVNFEPAEEVAATLAGVRVTNMNGFENMRWKVNQLAGETGRADRTFITNTLDAPELLDDADLIARGSKPEYIPQQFERYIENRYRIWSEAYRDIQNMRALNYTEKEIKKALTGPGGKVRKPFSEDDLHYLFKGYFNPPKSPYDRAGFEAFVEGLNRKNSAINKREGSDLKNNYKVKDFLDGKQLRDISKNWRYIPLRMPKAEQEEMLRLPIKSKRKLYQPSREEIQKLKKQQKDDQSFLPSTPLEAPTLDTQISTASRVSPTISGTVDQNTGLTGNETALLSPFEQEIAKRRNQGGIGSLA